MWTWIIYNIMKMMKFIPVLPQCEAVWEKEGEERPPLLPGSWGGAPAPLVLFWGAGLAGEGEAVGEPEGRGRQPRLRVILFLPVFLLYQAQIKVLLGRPGESRSQNGLDAECQSLLLSTLHVEDPPATGRRQLAPPVVPHHFLTN